MKKMIDYQVAGRPSQGYLSQPEQQGDTPGILVLHAWWGLTDFFRSVCDHLAKEGYTAFAPDLYGGQTADTVPDAQRLAETLDFQETRERVLMGLQVLKDYSGKEARIGALGFSLGAAWALYLSCLQPDDLQAVVVFYGSEAIDFSQAKCAYQGHFSDNDEWEPIEGVRKMETVLKEAGREVSINIYPEVKHWFFEQDRPEYDPDASTVAWERSVEFLNQHLGKNTSESGETSNVQSQS